MLRHALTLAGALALAACTVAPFPICRPGEEAVVADTLYFGTNKPGGVVSADEWQDFLATGVTPRFPQGITSWRASGQWRSETGKLEHEAPGVLPSDSHIDIALTGLRGAYATGADKGGDASLPKRGLTGASARYATRRGARSSRRGTSASPTRRRSGSTRWLAARSG